MVFSDSAVGLFRALLVSRVRGAHLRHAVDFKISRLQQVGKQYHRYRKAGSVQLRLPNEADAVFSFATCTPIYKFRRLAVLANDRLNIQGNG